MFNIDRNTTLNIAVIFHNADADGYCSCAIAMRYFKQYPNVSPYYIGMNYDDKLDYNKLEIVGKDGLLMCDFSLPAEEMIALEEKYGDKFIWIDHHISAINESEEKNYSYIRGVRKSGDVAACYLTWDFLFPNYKIPYSIKLISDHDIWNHNDPNSIFYSFGLRNFDIYPTANVEFWNKVLDDTNTDRIIDMGKIIHEYEERQSKNICRGAGVGLIEFEGLKAVIVNRSNINSLFFNSVVESEYDIMMVFSFKPIKSSWVFSLYTEREDIDVSLIAKKYGGGGHAGAAGFVTTDFEVVKEILSHTLPVNKRTFIKK